MLTVMLLTPNSASASFVENLIHESGVFRLVVKPSPIRSPHETMRLIGVHDPEVILLDLADWSAISSLPESDNGAIKPTYRRACAFPPRGVVVTIPHSPIPIS